eukprot:833729-Alexandrium_andersonii.AAC.1
METYRAEDLDQDFSKGQVGIKDVENLNKEGQLQGIESSRIEISLANSLPEVISLSVYEGSGGPKPSSP